jgi:agmatine deiminase
MLESLSEQAISVPPEWAPQKAIWTAWPANAEEWNGDLASPRRDVAALVRALAPSNHVRLLVAGEGAEASARAALEGAAEFIPARYGDIWLRDTGPIFARTATGVVALRFQTNGWGGKFDLPDDANRNGWTEAQAEAALVEAFGARKVVWLDRGLRNDHTDGHIDVLARFVGPALVVCQSPSGADDPNADVLAEIACTLEAGTDALGRRFGVVRIPSPGRVVNELGEALPASHMNFVIANGVVAVPVYGTPSAARAVEALQAVFRDRKVVGLPSLGLLGSGSAGGGSFHCITREEPA